MTSGDAVWQARPAEPYDDAEHDNDGKGDTTGETQIASVRTR